MESAPARAQSHIPPFRLSKMPSQPARDKGCGTQRLDTHNAACGIDSKTALRVLSVTQSRFRMQKAHSNLDDAAHR